MLAVCGQGMPGRVYGWLCSAGFHASNCMVAVCSAFDRFGMGGNSIVYWQILAAAVLYGMVVVDLLWRMV